MRHTTKVLGTLACGLLLTAAASAATVEVEWNDPTGFRDIEATDVNQKNFQKRVMEEMEEQFRSDAAALASDQTLHIVVKDVDLAGEIEYFHSAYPFGLRVIRNVDAPSMVLSYELRDANDKVVKSGEELKVRDSGFRFTNLMPLDRSPFRYERALITEWYHEAFTNGS